MRRYHLLFIIYYSFFCCCGASAQPNARLQELEKTLKERGFDVTHVQRSSRGIEQRWTSGLHLSSGTPTISKELLQKMSADQLKAFRLRIDSTETARKQRTVEAIDLIRSTFSALASTASESYMYEVHNKECDTIRLSMAWKDESHPLSSWRSDGGVLYDGGREAVMFNFHRPPGKDWSSGYYSHVYTAPYPEPMGDIKSFDGKAFQSLISPCLKRALKLKGAKKYPVYWRHDEGYNEEVGELILKVTRMRDYADNKHTGLTTGDLYFIPKTFENEARELLATLDSLSHAYVETHYDQDYSYHYHPRFSYNNNVTLVSGGNWPDKQPVDTDYYLCTYMDDDGFYFLSVTTEGEIWMPRDYPKLKSWINGQRVYRK